MKINLKLTMGLCYIALIITTIICCGSGSKKRFDYGHIKDNTYFNSFFGLEVKLPPNWIILRQEQLKNMKEKGIKLLTNNKNLSAIIKASEVNTANLLGICKYENGAPVDFNPSLVLVAENLKDYPGVKTGSDYLFHASKLLKQVQLEYYIDEEFEKETINNQEFYLMNTSINMMELDITQIYYVTIRNGFALGIIITFIDDEQKKELERAVKSMKFNKD